MGRLKVAHICINGVPPPFSFHNVLQANIHRRLYPDDTYWYEIHFDESPLNFSSFAISDKLENIQCPIRYNAISGTIKTHFICLLEIGSKVFDSELLSHVKCSCCAYYIKLNHHMLFHALVKHFYKALYKCK